MLEDATKHAYYDITETRFRTEAAKTEGNELVLMLCGKKVLFVEHEVEIFDGRSSAQTTTIQRTL